MNLFERWLVKFNLTNSSRKLPKIIGLTLLIGSIAFLSLLLVQGWTQIKPYLSQVNVWLLAAGQLCTMAALLLGGIMWGLIQDGVGLGFGWQQGLAIHLISGITKYIPGYAWQYMSKAYLSRQRGASSRQVMLAILSELVLLLLGGVVTAALWGWLAGERWHLLLPVPSWGWFVLGVGALLGVVVWTMLASRLGVKDHQKQAWLALGLAAAGWMMFGLATWLIARSLYPVSLVELPQFVFALVSSGIISLLVIIVPGGLGVRETALTLLLNGILPLTLGGVVSVMVRLSVIIAELVGTGLVLQLKLIQRSETKLVLEKDGDNDLLPADNVRW